MPPQHAIIIGAGICGVATALALTKHNGVECSIFEIRSEPATVGGSIQLTPNALRYLEHLGVISKLLPIGYEAKCINVHSLRTGKKLGKVDFDNVAKFKYRALRTLRDTLLHAMLETLSEAGVQVQYGMKIESVSEAQGSIKVAFGDGTVVEGDMLLGCDGIHSAVRTKFVESSREPEYTGAASAYGLLDVDENLRRAVPIDASSLYTGRSGLICTYTNAERTRLVMTAVMDTKDVGSREGWALWGKYQDAMKRELLERFGPRLPFYEKLLERVQAVTMYPIYRLSGNGRWISGHILLLGDAAHAMPPQGESLGLAIEDGVLLSQILLQRPRLSVTEVYQLYERVRRPKIETAVKVANLGFETVKHRSWLMTVLIEWMIWIFLAVTASQKERQFAYDVRELDFQSSID